MCQGCNVDAEVLLAVAIVEAAEAVVDLAVDFLHAEDLHLAASVEDSVGEHEAMLLTRAQGYQPKSILYKPEGS